MILMAFVPGDIHWRDTDLMERPGWLPWLLMCSPWSSGYGWRDEFERWL